MSKIKTGFSVILCAIFAAVSIYAAEVKITQLPESTAPTYDDLTIIVDSPGVTPTTQKATLGNLVKAFGWFDSRAYATLELANTAAYAAGKLLVVSQNYTLAAGATTLTANILRIPGGSFTHVAGSTLAFSSSFENPSDGQCFIGFDAGDVTFAVGKVKAAKAEWFATNTTPGTTDMYTAIQSAINSLTAGDVDLSEVKHMVSTQLVMKSNVYLKGHGRNSAIYWTGGYGYAIFASGINNFGIEGIRVYSGGTADTDCTVGIYITAASYNGYVKRCFIDTVYLGIVVGAVDTTSSYSIDILENTVNNTGNNGISINAYGNDYKIEHNLLYNFGVRAAGAVVAAGIEIRGANRVSCSHNIMKDSNYGGAEYVDGIRIEYGTEGATNVPDQISCIGNIINTVSGHGFRVSYATNSVISGNTIKNTGGNGILLLSSDTNDKRTEGNVIKGNVISNITGYKGICLEGDGSYAVRYNNISDNVIRACGTGISITLGDENIISNNLIDSSIGGGISHVSGNGNIFSGNQTNNNGAHGIGLTTGDMVMVNNHISRNNTTQGLAILVAVTNTQVHGGDFSGNGTDILNASTTTTYLTLNATRVWDPGSLADGAGETFVGTTVTGAALKDFCQLTAPYDLQGIDAKCWVQAADLVDMRVQNETGGTINLASGTWKVRVMK